ncbi:MAG TPA: hypothetical protein VMW91_08400, partial [Desulfosporosinus sp.]|nr:hypothetical protein [Desulfosporosinus sp.]
FRHLPFKASEKNRRQFIHRKPSRPILKLWMDTRSGLTPLISVQRSDGVFLLETDWLFEGKSTNEGYW